MEQEVFGEGAPSFSKTSRDLKTCEIFKIKFFTSLFQALFVTFFPQGSETEKKDEDELNSRFCFYTRQCLF